MYKTELIPFCKKAEMQADLIENKINEMEKIDWQFISAISTTKHGIILIFKTSVDKSLQSLKSPNKRQNTRKINNEKEKYFTYYDDVKHFSKGKEDW